MPSAPVSKPHVFGAPARLASARFKEVTVAEALISKAGNLPVLVLNHDIHFVLHLVAVMRKGKLLITPACRLSISEKTKLSKLSKSAP